MRDDEGRRWAGVPGTPTKMALATALAWLGCGDGGASGAHPISPRRASNPSCLARPAPPRDGRVALVPAFDHAYPAEGLASFPTELVPSPMPGDDDWYLTLQTGQLLRIPGGGSGDATVVLDVADRMPAFAPGGAAGLLSLAFHPRFADNGYLFVVYTAPPPDGRGVVSRVARFTMADDGTVDPSSEVVFLDEHQPNASHTGNHVAFGPDDGFLYFSIGDDRQTDVHGQDPHTLQAALLRIDVDRADTDRGTPYAIPPNNPFADGIDGAPEVFAYGLRNPWRFTFEPTDGRLLLGDVGQDRREELNVVEGGENFGWPIREGTLCYRRDPCDGGFADPLFELNHPEHRSITPGFVYSRDDIPGLRGRYVMSDFGSGSIYSVDLSDPGLTVRRELEGSFFVVSMARGHDGSVYALRYDIEGNGGIYRLAAPEPTDTDGPAFPERLSETGCVDPEDPRRPAPGLLVYRPASELWSDGAAKERFLALPDDQRITPGEDGDFDLPRGTVLMKHFAFGDRLHETRLFMHADDGWHGVSYRWADDQTDATLLDGSLDETLPSGVRWHYPSRSECNGCHTGAAGFSLGLEARQLDWAWADGPGAGDATQLAWLLDHDWFPEDVLDLAAVRRGTTPLPDPRDPMSADRERRIASYLHANCAGCHRPGGPTNVDIDLRYDTPFADKGLCEVEPLGRVWDLEVWTEQRIVDPGVPEWSTLWLRMAIQGLFRMPPLASSTVDEEMTTLVADWIREMGACP